MVCAAMSYFTASPNCGSGDWLTGSMCVQDDARTATAVTAGHLKRMSILLLETDRLTLRRTTGGRWRRRRTVAGRRYAFDLRNAVVRSSHEEQIAFIGRRDAVGRRLERTGANRADEPRRHDDDQFRLFALE